MLNPVQGQILKSCHGILWLQTLSNERRKLLPPAMFAAVLSRFFVSILKSCHGIRGMMWLQALSSGGGGLLPPAGFAADSE